MTSVRMERRDDREAVRLVNEAAFGRPNEADLVDAVREAAPAALSFVAVRKGLVGGCLLFTRVSIGPPVSDPGILGLGPLAVLPDLQSRGIGSLLVRDGLKECVRLGFPLVVVLGSPRYYSRFGFSQASLRGLRCESDVPDEVFMVAELASGALGGRTGVVRYRPEFAQYT